MTKIRVGILFGGQSVEHEVSINSAKNIYKALDRTKFEPILIGIDKSGKWFKTGDLSLENKIKQISPSTDLTVQTDPKNTNEKEGQIDVVFPILHGTNGEDGTIQGLLKLIGIPFVGAGILGSAVGMDKDVAKRLLRDAKIPVAEFTVVRRTDELSFEQAVKEFGLPFFLKPANSGSSVGVHKIKSESDYLPALADALSFDSKVIIEEFIDGREIECSVLGNENPTASTLGEIIPHHEFYSYDAKYIDENGAELIIPAKLSAKQTKEIQDLAVKAFQVLCCEGMARVDFFVTKSGKTYVNEINTIPGFTNISMYPKLWEASGINQTELITRLINLAIDRNKNHKSLVTNYKSQNHT